MTDHWALLRVARVRHGHLAILVHWQQSPQLSRIGCAVPEMVRVRSGQAHAWPLLLTGVAVEVPGLSVTSCAVTQTSLSVLVVLRSQSRLGWRDGHVHSADNPQRVPGRAYYTCLPPGHATALALVIVVNPAVGT